ncbi:MAG: large repetitive protein [Gaiellaceae bacterium]|jgi:hypothetical protein|nr:large repetitive protein [Gaiellaceae bacterium]
MAADRRLLAAAFVVISFLTAGPARAAVTRPAQLAPAAGAVVQFLPAFAWTPVAGADKYEFQIGADSGMNSPVLGDGKDNFFTRNTRATLQMTVPNGTYWWRVRATNAAGDASAWTQPRSFRKLWNLRPALQTPTSGDSLSFPSKPVVLRWSGIAGAADYLVSVASDPTLGSLVFHYQNQDDPKGAPNVSATSAAITAALAPGSYYWSVMPVDAEGNRGVATPVASFSWLWSSVTATQLDDLNPAPEAYDPRFSWNPVPGAAKYEVEINSSSDFAPGSKVCCTGTTIATSLSPTEVFKDNVFYWRVRALDPDGNAGVWNYGGSFTKTFDKVGPAGPVTGTSIKNLRMRDNLGDPGTDVDTGTAGYQTRVPVVRWDAVPGAASYEVQVADWTGAACSWATASYLKKTSVPEWAPLSTTSSNPVVWQGTLAVDQIPTLTPGTYCFRVRARSDRAPGSQEVWGDYTYLQNGDVDSTGPVGPAFTWSAYPDPADPAASTPCAFGYPCAGDYLEPLTGTTTLRTPLFTWKPLAGANAYYVVVAKDANFSNVIDEAFTRVPAYAPRNSLKPTTYADETTTFYWAVLPASASNGSDALPLDLPNSAKGSFQKQSTPPSLVSPVGVQAFLDQPTFRWTPTLGARRYRLQVAADPTFGAPLDDVVTDATSYSSDTTYPADTVLYWRVRADDENLTGLTWSATGTFQKKLAAPVPSSANPVKGEALPVWAWSSIQGAASYDLSIDQPDGTHRDFTDFRTPVASFIKMTGTGVWHWRVRAEFPKDASGTVPGPYSATQSFTRTIGEPANARTDSAKDHVLLSWDPRLGVKEYKAQISSTPDFSRVVESVSTDNTSYAPTMTQYGYQAGGTLYWRVAGVDEDRNQGDWTQSQQIRLQPQLRLTVSGFARRRHAGRVTARVVDGQSRGVAGVRVRVTGAGLRARSKRTNARGQVVFTVKPKKRGKLVFSATKAGYQPAYGSVKVR